MNELAFLLLYSC